MSESAPQPEWTPCIGVEFSSSSTCRLCLNQTGEHDIFTSHLLTGDVSCLQMISVLFSFSIRKDDGLPSKICPQCKERILSSYEFKIVGENANKRLQYLISETDKLQKLICSIEQCKEKSKHKVGKDISQQGISLDKDGINNALKEACLQSDDDCVATTNYMSSEDFDEDDKKPLVFMKTLPQLGIMEVGCEGKAKLQKKILVSRIGENGKEKYLCDFCPKEFTDKSSRRRHRKVQHFGILYYCEICKKSYRSKASHEIYHRIAKNKTHPCPVCNKTFTTYYGVQCHKKTHSKQSEYICNVCGKKFADKHLSMAHKRRVHDKERPYQCSYCSKTFFSSHSLKDHITTHTKERRYACTVCGMLFTTSTILKEHQMRHTGNKDFVCQECEKRFYRKKDLTRHQLIHSKTYEHQCTYCGLKFRRKDHLSTHEKGIHNIVKDIKKQCREKL